MQGLKVVMVATVKLANRKRVPNQGLDLEAAGDPHIGVVVIDRSERPENYFLRHSHGGMN